ncbi:MAG: glycosyltransferase, partial [Anaerolineae bacterium]
PHELAAAICAALHQPHELSRLAQQGRQTVLDRYDWDQVAERLEDVWEAVVTNYNSQQIANASTASQHRTPRQP